MTVNYFSDTDIQVYLNNISKLSDTLRPKECLLCNALKPICKHGTYRRWVLFLVTEAIFIPVLRYYCSECGKTVSFLPSFCIPHKQFSSTSISRCFFSIFNSDISINGIRQSFCNISRSLLTCWLRQWDLSNEL